MRDLIKYFKASLGYFGAFKLDANDVATGSVFAIKPHGGPVTLELVAGSAGDDMTIVLEEGTHYGTYKQVTVTSGEAIIYPTDYNTKITRA